MLLYIVNYQREQFKNLDMKKPLYNKYERWQIINIDCLDTDLKKLNIAILHFRRQIQKDFERVFKL